MHDAAFMEAVERIVAKDKRYDPEAYAFVREALDFTVKSMGKPRKGARRHISGRELLDGIRRYAIQEYGPMARTVIESWSVRRTEDFGELVFNLVESGVLGRTEEDSKADFGGGYDFAEAFARPFQPAAAPARGKAPGLRGRGRPAGKGKETQPASSPAPDAGPAGHADGPDAPAADATGRAPPRSSPEV